MQLLAAISAAQSLWCLSWCWRWRCRWWQWWWRFLRVHSDNDDEDEDDDNGENNKVFHNFWYFLLKRLITVRQRNALLMITERFWWWLDWLRFLPFYQKTTILASLLSIVKLIGNGYETRKTSKEQTQITRFILEGPRPCTIFSLVLIHFGWIT